MGNPHYNPRFYLKHHEFIQNTVIINDVGPNITEMKFSIYGDPLPLTRNIYHDQYYSVAEIDLFRLNLEDLIVGHIFVPFPPDQEIQIEIFYHLKQWDRYLPEDSLYTLSDELVEAMSGIFYRDMTQVVQTITYKAASSNDEGMIMFVMKNEINDFNDSDFDDPTI